MVDHRYKQPENAPGKWYVDSTCVPCHVCLEEAPGLLAYATDESHVFFKRQPVTAEETKLASNAMQACPTEAIGDDG
ncbi:MAG: ferredoxin [Spirochaetia bacterium]|nr:ferredoxin [Spirochaetia bacterium]